MLFFMEIIWFFGFISSVVLSFIIANAGAKRQIGFGWSLFLGIWLTPIVSLITVLLSDRLQPDEYGRLEKKWGCMIPFIITFLIVGTVAYAINSYSNRDKQRARTSIEFRIPEFLKKKTASKHSEIVFKLTDMEMTLNYDFSSSIPKGTAVVKLDFIIENISKEPQILYSNNLSLFDYNECRYDVSTTFTSNLNPLLFSETINPNTKKKLSVVFEVPQGELYSVGFSDNIERIGKQIFVDKIRNIKCEYVTYKEMKEVRKRIATQSPQRNTYDQPQPREEIAPEIIFEEPSNSAYNALTKKGTNPTNEIEIDLNDFLGTPDDGTDWNSTELSETDCKALVRQGIYYSESKGTWVKEKLSNDKLRLEAERRAEQERKEQSICKISFDLQGRQAEQIPSVTNKNSITGYVFIKIVVSPNGDVVNCDIDKRSIINDSQLKQLCVSSSMKMKFNAVDSKLNQTGTIRYNFIAK